MPPALLRMAVLVLREFRELAETWKAAGDNAREIFLFQKLEDLLTTLVATVPEVEVEKVTGDRSRWRRQCYKNCRLYGAATAEYGLRFLTHAVQRFVDNGQSQGSLTDSQHHGSNE